jgi:4-amino-4-deoxy-L-arabinose transferase-like glycosyltransferase
MTASTAAPAPSDAGEAVEAPGPRRFGIDAILVGLVVVAGVALRFATTSDLWFDEALSVNIASLPLSELGDALKQDGAPPLYYTILHFWIELFGSGDIAVRAFSGLISVASLPLAYLAGKRIGGRAVAWWTVMILAASPYAIRYATESRMYALVMFLVLWGYLALRRALEKPSIGRLAVVALVTALLVYTQYWCFYVLAVVGAGLLVAWWKGSAETKRAAPRIIVAMVIGGLTLIPWLSTLTYQLSHTGTPWGDPVVPWFAFAEGLVSFAGGDESAEAFILLLPLVLLPLLALFAAPLDGRRIELDLKTRPAVRWELGAAVAILLFGASVSWVAGSAFEGRYAAVMYPLLLLAIAYGLTAFADRRVRAVVLAVTVLLSFASAVRNVTEERTQAAQVADVIKERAEPGDLVVYCPDQIGPDVSRLLEDVPVRQATFPDGARPERVDWVDYQDRIAAADPVEFAQRMLDRADDSTVFYVSSGGYNNVQGVCELMSTAFANSREPSTPVLPDDEFFELMGLSVFPVT